jgi:hypothetical protein
VFAVGRHFRGKWVCANCEKLVAPHIIDTATLQAPPRFKNPRSPPQLVTQ